MHRLLPLLLLLACGEDPPPDARDPGESDLPEAPAVPPTAPMRRLTRTEIGRSVQDLLQVNPAPVGRLPPDDVAYGFDGISSAQSLSPLHLEVLESVAEQLALAAIAEAGWSHTALIADLQPPPGERYLVADGRPEPWWMFDRPEFTVSVPFELPVDGEWQIDVESVWVAGWGPGEDGATPPYPTLLIHLDGQPWIDGQITGLFDQSDLLSGTVALGAGRHDLSITGRVAHGAVALRAVTVHTPDGQPAPARQALLSCDPDLIGVDTCADTILGGLVRRAWRRPATAAEAGRLRGLVHLALDQGEPFERGLALAVQAILLSPKFVFLVETDGAAAGEERPLDSWELAARLSYLVWASAPDDPLLDCAARGELNTDEGACGLSAQVARMLDDPRADALSVDFGGQWLGLGALDGLSRDAALYPTASPMLYASMRGEVLRFLDEARATGLSAVDVLDARFTWVDAQLGSLYNVGVPPGGGWHRVLLDLAPRGGVLRQAAWLTVTSQATRTSPVRRGQWLLSRALCDPPADPPPGIPALDEQAVAAGGMREQMEAHSHDPACAWCHQAMDPLGLAFEGYDALGAERADVAGVPIDPSGTLPDGRSFSDAGGLIALLRDDPAVPRCVATQLGVWALGRPLTGADTPTLDQVLQEAPTTTWGALITAWARSRPFTHRTAQGAR